MMVKQAAVAQNKPGNHNLDKEHKLLQPFSRCWPGTFRHLQFVTAAAF